MTTMNRARFEQLLNLKMRPIDVKLVMKAYQDAKYAHGYENQKRDNGERYFEHPRRVALIVMRELEIYDPDMIIAALLHDTVEDTFSFGSKDEAYDRIKSDYNQRVATFVVALSKDPCQILEEKAERDNRYFLGIEEEGPKTMTLKLSDRLENFRDVSLWDKKRKMRYVEETRGRILPMALLVIPQFSGNVRRNLRHVYKEMVIICEKIDSEVAS